MTSTEVALSPWFCAVEIGPLKIMFACTREMHARISPHKHQIQKNQVQ